MFLVALACIVSSETVNVTLLTAILLSELVQISIKPYDFKKKYPKELLQNHKTQIYHHKIMVRSELRVKAVIKSGTVKSVKGIALYKKDHGTIFSFLSILSSFLKGAKRLTLTCQDTFFVWKHAKVGSPSLSTLSLSPTDLQRFLNFLLYLCGYERRSKKLGLHKAVALQILAVIRSFVVTGYLTAGKKEI